MSFTVDEQTYVELARLKREGKMKAGIEVGAPVHVQLVSETKTFRNGKIEFVDGQMNPAGIACRASVSNSDGLLLPGMSARVKLQSGPTHRAILLPSSAWTNVLSTGERILVLTQQNVVEPREVSVEFNLDGAWAVARGVKDGELVVLDATTVKAGQQVIPQLVDWERLIRLSRAMPRRSEPDEFRGARTYDAGPGPKSILVNHFRTAASEHAPRRGRAGALGRAIRYPKQPPSGVSLAAIENHVGREYMGFGRLTLAANCLASISATCAEVAGSVTLSCGRISEPMANFPVQIPASGLCGKVA